MIQELAFTARFCCNTKAFFSALSLNLITDRGGVGGGGGVAALHQFAHFYTSIGLINQHGIKILTSVWPNLFLLNVFTTLKGTHLYIFI